MTLGDDRRSSDSSSEEEEDDEEGWLDVEPDEDEESVAIISLLDDRVFPDAASMLSHCKAAHGFDFLAVRDRLTLDFYGTVKLINFVRQRVHEGLRLPEQISLADIQDDSYLKPVLDDDALILCLDDLPPSTATTNIAETSPAGVAGQDKEGLRQRNEELQAELERLTQQFASYRSAVQKTLDQRWGEADETPAGSKTKEEKQEEDDARYYFASYAHNDIHETMLKDTVRTEAYRDFIYNNKHLFHDKVVLDIGCGTGILSMFCAKAGARQVIAVDRSDIIDKARENIFHNGLSGQITCLKGTMEQVKLPVDSVDIIVSEWMGYGLLFEAMLPSVIWARDKYLKPDGLVVPSHTNIWLGPVADADYVSDNVGFWNDVYGFDLKAMQAGILSDVRVQTMPSSSLCGTLCMFRCLDLHHATKEDLVFTAPWQTTLEADVDALDGFLLWFDTYFDTARTEQPSVISCTAEQWIGKSQERVAFTTGPFGTETHWRQCLMLSEGHGAGVSLSKGQSIAGDISFEVPESNARALNLRMKWAEREDVRREQVWELR